MTDPNLRYVTFRRARDIQHILKISQRTLPRETRTAFGGIVIDIQRDLTTCEAAERHGQSDRQNRRGLANNLRDPRHEDPFFCGERRV